MGGARVGMRDGAVLALLLLLLLVEVLLGGGRLPSAHGHSTGRQVACCRHGILGPLTFLLLPHATPSSWPKLIKMKKRA